MVDWNKPESFAAAITRTGMAVGDFAQMAGISRQQTYKLLAGKFKPRFETQQRINDALAVIEKRQRRAASTQGASA